MIHSAPIARKVAFEVAPDDCKFKDVAVPRIREWFRQIESCDPALAQILDLRFFGGLSAKDTAFALKISGETVAGNMKIAHAWWQRLVTPN